MPSTRLAPCALLALSLFSGAAPANQPQRVSETAATATSETMSAEQLADALLERDRGFLPDDMPGAERTLRAAMDREPREARWPLALGLLKMRDDKASDAKPLLAKATELAPDNADALNWHANALFATIDEAGLLAKGRMAGQAKDMLERAVAIDPSYVDARIALVEFYRNAPGIAGGSTKKAKEHAEAMLAQPGGAFHGHRLLAQMAAKAKDWNEADRQFALAAKAAGDEDDALQITLARGYMVLNDKKDAAGALAILKQVYDARGVSADATTVYLYARALAETGDCSAAIPLFERVLELNPGARHTRFLLAECLAKSGDTPGAIARYEDFLERFPDDDNAGKAKKALRELKKST